MSEEITKFWLIFQHGGAANPRPLAARSLKEAIIEVESLHTAESGWAAMYDVADHRGHRPARATRSITADGFGPWVYPRN